MSSSADRTLTFPPPLLVFGAVNGPEARVDRHRFVAQTTPVVDVVVDHRHPQSIPPDVEHFVEPQGPVRFSIAFLAPQE
jgi:hypothetical protein